ncbi:MAG: DUF1311 domain-containing protein [Proteobacteria bacterium]|nr:DUF1311 domain-containing protein [Pseudomonadota bacterium]
MAGASTSAAPPPPAASPPAAASPPSPPAPELAPATFIIRAQPQPEQASEEVAAPLVQAEPPPRPLVRDGDSGAQPTGERIAADRFAAEPVTEPTSRPPDSPAGAVSTPEADRPAPAVGSVAERSAAAAPPARPAPQPASEPAREPVRQAARPSSTGGPLADELPHPASTPLRGSRLAGVDPRDAPRERSRAPLLVGGIIGLAAVSALAAVALLWSDREEGASEPPEPAQTQQQADGAAAGAFVPPDREAVREAYAEVGRVYRASGVSGLAEVGRSCFAGLAEQPSYRGLDYCTALDAFGAAFAQRVNGAPPAPDSWFGQAEGRYLSTAEQVMGPERDAAARLVDIRRLAIEVAREGGPAFAAASSAQGSSTVSAPPDSAPVAPGAAAAVGPAPTRPAGLPRSVELETVPAPSPSGAASPPAPPALVRRAEAPRPARLPPDEAERRAYAAARGGPTAAEVAAARPRTGRGPSFNCRGARSSAERLICQDPELASLDRRLNAAYEDAIAAGADRRSLRSEQDQWLGVRERAAPDPDAVADAYRRRIEELDSLR